jgi:hypothetical protein
MKIKTNHSLENTLINALLYNNYCQLGTVIRPKITETCGQLWHFKFSCVVQLPITHTISENEDPLRQLVVYLT